MKFPRTCLCSESNSNTRFPSLWSKTTLITGGVGGTWVDPPSCKMATFQGIK